MKKSKTRPKQPPKLREQVEEFLQKSHADIKKMPPGDVRNLFEDLQIYQAELEKYNNELLKTQEQLQESEEKYRSLLDDVIDSSDAGLFILDSDFKVVWVNQASERYFGLKREEVVGINKRQLIQEQIKYNFEDPEGFAERVLATYDNNTYVENFECHMLSGNNREDRWLEHWSRPIRSGLYSGGRIELYYNITDRVRAETLLKESEERYREIVEGTDDLITRVDSEGRFIYVNHVAEKIFGIRMDQCVGMSAFDFIHPDDRERTKTEFNRWVHNKLRSITIENRQVNKITGEIYHVLWTSNFHYDEKGNLIGINGISRDITERKQTEEEREKLINELQEALKEIKTLRGILPFCSFCKKIRDDKGYWEQVDVYIHKYSQADISHSVCTDCAKKHYPDSELFDD